VLTTADRSALVSEKFINVSWLILKGFGFLFLVPIKMLQGGRCVYIDIDLIVDLIVD
jgi:hypothetical protein